MLKLFSNYGETIMLDNSQLAVIITCIPKGDKNRKEIKNWHPITLLNSTYKFYSGIIADRLKNKIK